MIFVNELKVSKSLLGVFASLRENPVSSKNAKMQKVTASALILIIAFAVFSSIANAQSRKDTPVRVMTFNIRYDEPRDGINAWTPRKDKVAGVIRFHKADLVGVQEALLGQLRDLKSLLPGFSWCGVGRTDGKEAGEYSAILYRDDRFQLLETRTFWLSETPDVAGSKGWDAAYPRIVTWARLKDRVTKKVFYHFNTHFDHRGERARTESATLILKRIEEIAGSAPFVLTGDLNVKEDSGAYKTLRSGSTKLHLADTRYASVNGHFGGDSTFSSFKELEPGNTIDHIFVRQGTRVLEHGTLSDRWNGLWASDHLPVLTEIIF